MQSTSLDGHTILIVEDEPVIAMDIASACEAAGARSACRRIAGGRHPPGRTRRAIRRRARVGGGRLNERDMPYVLHSGYRHLGDNCHRGIVVEKPASPFEIIDVLGRLLGGHNR